MKKQAPLKEFEVKKILCKKNNKKYFLPNISLLVTFMKPN